MNQITNLELHIKSCKYIFLILTSLFKFLHYNSFLIVACNICLLINLHNHIVKNPGLYCNIRYKKFWEVSLKRNSSQFNDKFLWLLFLSFIFCFLSLLARKLQKYYLIFDYILQGKMGKTEKNRIKSHTTSDQNTKNQKKKYGINETYVCFGYKVWGI